MTTVLVTGVGGGVGQSIIKSLENSPYEVIGADGEVLGTGLYAVGTGYLIPYASSKEYADRLLDICQREKCQVLFPGLDAELPVLARIRAEMRAKGIMVIVSDPEVITIADDKLETARFLAAHNFPAPKTAPLDEVLSSGLESVHFPAVLKPRRGGARSKGVCHVANKMVLSHLLERLDTTNYIVQEHIEGEEYTCGSLTLGGICRGVIVMKRILRDGDTYKAFVRHDPALDSHIRAVANVLRPFGPCNFQLRVRDGVPYIFEINARCSGTTYCRTLAGFNEPLMMLDWLIAHREPQYDVREMTILRYWKELVVANGELKTMRAEGVRRGTSRRLGERQTSSPRPGMVHHAA
jgi:carbamoyl-phosphate synthase large subunit